ncbi:MAG: NAD(P)H-dependent oxidoreductase, partial [Mycoplasma sp.]|nr:NAD(P)H-dependent oxidoreductase [Mycoplasma sp.]
MNKNDYIDIEKLMKKRVSAKRFDPNHQIDDLTLDKLVESIRHSPSSMGL